MRVNDNQIRIFAGEQTDSGNVQNTDGRKRIQAPIAEAFARRQNSKDKVDQKKADAIEQAMKLVSNVYAADKSIDDDLVRRENRIQESKDKILGAQEELRSLDERQKEYAERYGVEPDSEEQKDLELLRKRRDSMKIDSGIELTQEEQKRLAEIDEKGMTEYQKLSLENDSYREPFEKEIKENKQIVEEEQIIIREVGLERLKSHPMVDAVKEKDAMMAAANKEIIGMVLEDGKDKVDEDMQEVKEELAEAKEEKKQEEERIEELQRRADELEAESEKRREEHKNDLDISDIDMDRMLELDNIKSDVAKEVDAMMQDMKLLTEDLKGAAVDTEL